MTFKKMPLSNELRQVVIQQIQQVVDALEENNAREPSFMLQCTVRYLNIALECLRYTLFCKNPLWAGDPFSLIGLALSRSRSGTSNVVTEILSPRDRSPARSRLMLS